VLDFWACRRRNAEQLAGQPGRVARLRHSQNSMLSMSSSGKPFLRSSDSRQFGGWSRTPSLCAENMDRHPDFKDLLAEFARSKVSFTLLGGYAVGYHAKPRATKDLDLLLSGQGDNLQHRW
jgi:hypothetical protein